MILVVNLLIWNSDESQCFDVIFQQFIGLGSPNLDNISAMAHATSTLLIRTAYQYAYSQIVIQLRAVYLLHSTSFWVVEFLFGETSCKNSIQLSSL